MKLYGPFAQLISMDGLPLKGPISDDELSIEENFGIYEKNGVINEIGPFNELASKYTYAEKISPSRNSWIVVPAFIDCHTHICWAGTRINDYALRVAGKGYLEIAASGGGIMDTVRATRAATEDELIQSIVERAKELTRFGISIIEVKSGYGLTVNDELKMLRAIKEANKITPARLISTFLGAHIRPKDFEGSNEQYLDNLIHEVVPVILEEKLANRADIFVEKGAFGVSESRRYMEKMKKLGFEITVHVDQFHPGGAELAAELGAVSADHLEYTGDAGIGALTDSDTVAVALPGASMGLGMKFSPARKLLDAGASVAIASDWNPGSAPMGNLLTQASVLGAAEKLSIAETLAGITNRAAYALRVEGGTISTGKEAKLAIFETEDVREIFYRQGQLIPLMTVIGEDCIRHD
ncbi:MAG: imidazolonepropionase [Cyanothece sp. SIO1E1]|nr:imidazolonepropionase [Cyanothece sp. SIO1E1]